MTKFESALRSVQELEELFHTSEELYGDHDENAAKGLRLLLTHVTYSREGFDHLRTKIRERCSVQGNNACWECWESLYHQYLATTDWPVRFRQARVNAFMEFWRAYQSVHSNSSSHSQSGDLVFSTSLDWGYLWKYRIHVSMEEHDLGREALLSHIQFLDGRRVDLGSWRTHKDIIWGLVDLARLETLCGNHHVAEACAQTASHFSHLPGSGDGEYHCDEDESSDDDSEDDESEDTDLEIAKTIRLRLLEALQAGPRVEGSATPYDSQRLSFLEEVRTSHLSRPRLQLSYRAVEALLDPETWDAVINCELSGRVGFHNIKRRLKSQLKRDIEEKFRRHDQDNLARRHFTTTLARCECGCNGEFDDGEICPNRLFKFTNEFGLKYMAPYYGSNVGYLFGSFVPSVQDSQ